MKRARAASPQTRTVLATLLAQAQTWRYGYDLIKETGLKAGTLYPLLIRLAEEGMLEAEWRPSITPGRPARHAYRLTAQGQSLANSLAEPVVAGHRAQPA